MRLYEVWRAKPKDLQQTQMRAFRRQAGRRNRGSGPNRHSIGLHATPSGLLAVGDAAVSDLLYPLVALGASVLGSLVLWYRSRRPRSFESSIDQFQRGLRALAPEGPTRARWHGGRGKGRGS